MTFAWVRILPRVLLKPALKACLPCSLLHVTNPRCVDVTLWQAAFLWVPSTGGLAKKLCWLWGCGAWSWFSVWLGLGGLPFEARRVLAVCFGRLSLLASWPVLRGVCGFW